MERGQIYWVRFDPTTGSEIQKTRPALIVSNDQSNIHSDLATVLPITSATGDVYPFEVLIPAHVSGLPKDSKIKANQIRTVDKSRLSGGPIGATLSVDLMEAVETAIKVHLQLS